jgi:hypothetical protein
MSSSKLTLLILILLGVSSERGRQLRSGWALGLEQKHVVDVVSTVDLGTSRKNPHRLSISEGTKLGSLRRFVTVNIK